MNLKKFLCTALAVIMISGIVPASVFAYAADYSANAATPAETIMPDSIAISKSTATLGVGQSVTPSAVVFPANAIQSKFWGTTNSSVATVTQEGKITARSEGTAIITVSTINGKTATCAVTVIAGPSSVTLNISTATIGVGQALSLKATVLPKSATGAINWSISNFLNASIDQNGLVKGLREGTVTVTASAYNDVKDTCTINIVPAPDKISIREDSISLGIGETYKASYAFEPAGTMASVSWFSSNAAVASVDSSGLIKAKTSGTTTIRAQAHNNEFDSYTVTVKPSPSSIALNTGAVSLGVGQTYSYKATLSPAGSASLIKWSSNNSNVASVSTTGKVTAKAAGSAKITVSTFNNKTYTSTVTVYPKPTSIKFKISAVTLGVGEALSTSYTIAPSGARPFGSYFSSAPGIANINSSGIITAVSKGTAVVSVKTYNDLKTDIKVTVLPAPTSISLSKTSVTLSQGTSTVLTNTLSSGSASNKRTYASSNTSVATVDQSGKVNAKAAGTAVISVTTFNNKVAKCTVKVLAAPTSAKMNYSAITLGVGQKWSPVVILTPSSAATNRTWKSSNTSVASVTSAGAVTALKAGTAVITATSYNGIEAKTTVTVKPAPETLTLSASSLTLGVGTSSTITYTLTPAGAYTTRSWTSSNTTVATVDGNGKVTAKSAGSAVITLTTHNGLKKTCTVKVLPAPTSVTLDKSAATIAAGQTLTLKASVVPSTAIQTKTWSSSNASVASVDSAGKVTAKAAGTAVITVKAYNGVSKSCTITVLAAPTSVTISPSKVTLGIGQVYTLKSTVSPANAANIKTWSSSNSTIASVDKNGVLTALKAGTCTITLKYYNGVSASIPVTVKPAPTSIAISLKTATIGVGEIIALSATPVPEGSYCYQTWKTSNAAVAVMSGGKVTAKAVGTAVISVTTHNGKTASCTVTVKAAPTSIAISTPLTMGVDQKATIKFTLSPSSCASSLIKWETTNSAIVSVDAKGSITAKAVGTATISATTYNNKKSSVKITVYNKPQAVALKSLYTDLGIGQLYTVSLSVTPSNAAKVGTWISSNESIAYVDQAGKVTPKKAGNVTISFTSYNGISNSVSLKINPAPVTVKLNKTSATLGVGQVLTLDALYTPSNATSSESWSSSNASVASVDSLGRITAKAVGTAIITVKTYNNLNAQCTVKVLAAPTGVKLSKTAIKGGVGETVKLSVTVSPSGAAAYGTWSSDNSKIATVNSSGSVLFKEIGTCTVTYSTYNGYTARCSVTSYIMPDALLLNTESITLGVSDTYTPKVIFSPSDSFANVTWESLNSAIATVDANGKITAKKIGSTKIVVTSYNGISNYCNIIVKAAPASVSLNKTAFSLGVGISTVITASLLPSGCATTKKWTSSNSAVASVDSDGKVTALSAGTAVITYSTHNNIKATATVKVYAAPTSISLNISAKSLGMGQTYTPVVTIVPADAYSSKKWTTSNASIATVSSSGLITPVAPGKATITITTYNNLTASITVTVYAAPTSLKLSKTALTLGVGETYTQVMTVTPTGAGVFQKWVSSDSTVATVSGTGLITAKKAGTAVITLSSYNNLTAKCTVTVKAAPNSIILDKNALTIGVSESYSTVITMLPAGSSSVLKWSTNNAAVATVSSSGVIKGIAAGTAIIKVITYNNKSFSVTVTVKNAPTTVKMNVQTLTLTIGQSSTLTSSVDSGAASILKTYTSSNKAVATVDPVTGQVKAVKAGTAVITVKTYNGLTATCTVTVK